MKIIHTADWHLGQRFYERDRLQEQGRFIDFLLTIIAREKVDLLIIAGDIFDTANPPTAAQHLYYDFITKLYALSHCKLVVIGGNHDCAAYLEAPSALLKNLQVHVIGALPDLDDGDLSRAVLRFEFDGLPLCVAAVPFLRDRDVRLAVAGESYEDMESRTKAGIVEVYKKIAKAVLVDKRPGEVVVATGHLTAVGGALSDSERSVHIGNLGSIKASEFGEGFDYVALGHLHHPQAVGGDENVRYSGSPIPLSFSESVQKELRLITIEKSGGTAVLSHEAIAIPLARPLLRLSGSLDEVEQEIGKLQVDEEMLPAWIEVMLSEGDVNPTINDQIRKLAAERGAEVLKVSRESVQKDFDPMDKEAFKPIDEWLPVAVFEKRIENYCGDVKKEQLLECFNHVLNAVQED